MYNNTKLEYVKNFDRTTSESVPWGANSHSYSESNALKSVVSFTCTNGLVVGDKVKPNPNQYTKITSYAGVGRYITSQVTNGFYSSVTPGYWYRGKIYRVKGPIRAEASTVSRNSGIPMERGWGYPSSSIRGRVRDTALAKVYDELRSGPNLIVDLAEGGATLRMLKGTLRFRSVLKDFFNQLVIPRKLRGASRGQQRLDYMTGKWLEYRYGWTPLVLSIYDAFDQLHREYDNKIITVKTRSGHSDTETVRVTNAFTPSNFVASPAVGASTEVWQHSHSHRCEYFIRFAPPPGQQIWNWTSLNPASIAWELTPLSFVADWLFTISQYLELMENTVIYSRFFLDGYRTDTYKATVFRDKTEYAESRALALSNSVFTQSYSDFSKGAGFEVRIKDRQILSSLPFPEGIHLKVKVNAKRQLDAAALVHQLVARRFR